MWPCQPAASWVSEAGNPPEVVQKCKTICTKKATLSFFFTSSSHFTSSMISLALVSSNCNFYTSFNLGTEVPYVLVLLLRDLHHIVILCRCRTYICSSHTHTPTSVRLFMACSPPGGAASSLSIHPPSSGTSILAKVLGLQVISDIVVDVCRSEVWVSELKGSQAWACYRHYLESYIYIDIFYIYESEDVCVYIYTYT